MDDVTDLVEVRDHEAFADYLWLDLVRVGLVALAFWLFVVVVRVWWRRMRGESHSGRVSRAGLASYALLLGTHLLNVRLFLGGPPTWRLAPLALAFILGFVAVYRGLSFHTPPAVKALRERRGRRQREREGGSAGR